MTELPVFCLSQPLAQSSKEGPPFPFSKTLTLRPAKERQTLRFRCSCLETTHLNGAPRDRPVHIIADNEVSIQHCVLLILRLPLLGECRLEPDVCLEKQSKLKLKGTVEHADDPLHAIQKIRFQNACGHGRNLERTFILS